jgi:hypothetical protein
LNEGRHRLAGEAMNVEVGSLHLRGLLCEARSAAAFVMMGRLDSAESLLTEALGHFTTARNVVPQAEWLAVMGTIRERAR